VAMADAAFHARLVHLGRLRAGLHALVSPCAPRVMGFRAANSPAGQRLRSPRRDRIVPGCHWTPILSVQDVPIPHTISNRLPRCADHSLFHPWDTDGMRARVWRVLV
jgi:hypothetical protein